MAISESRPWVSQAIAVHPEQVAELNESCRARGINGGYRPDGTFEAHSRKARAQEMEHRGFIDRDGGDKDYTGR